MWATGHLVYLYIKAINLFFLEDGPLTSTQITCVYIYMVFI